MYNARKKRLAFKVNMNTKCYNIINSHRIRNNKYIEIHGYNNAGLYLFIYRRTLNKRKLPFLKIEKISFKPVFPGLKKFGWTKKSKILN